MMLLKRYTLALVPLSPLSGDYILMIYTKDILEPGLSLIVVS
ncbi:MAG: hypothetical protein KatS3mg003_1286 [Candidatus Nitrosocaldaceae archaeon]|nr:MAG: hypothetical protein KatS3mg003_0385 [Candidatus Nitrosocaldaceae archaeon]GIU71807.1 MAG: hypothetical protein KatS3mg003_1286 [Candidatus Nitrosocaldaceae archaeon]